MISLSKTACALLGAVSIAAPAGAQVHRTPPAHDAPATEPAAGSVCSTLADDWADAGRDISKLRVENIADDSAPRATMRSARESGDLLRAMITLELMRDHHCPLPLRAPGAVIASVTQ